MVDNNELPEGLNKFNGLANAHYSSLAEAKAYCTGLANPNYSS
jgi:hypothetical protein